MEALAQILGVISSALAVISYQFKKKQQMLGLCAAANFITATSFLLLGNAPVMTANGYFASIQCLVNAIRAKLGKKAAGSIEKTLVFVIFAAIGIIRYNSPLDLMPFAASMFFVLSTFQRSEQKIRILVFFNTVILLVYSIIAGSSVVIGHAFSLASLVTSYLRERKADE